MTKVAPYHTNSDQYEAEIRKVHHTSDDCPYGSRIKREHLSQGGGGRPLCDWCSKH